MNKVKKRTLQQTHKKLLLILDSYIHFRKKKSFTVNYQIILNFCFLFKVNEYSFFFILDLTQKYFLCIPLTYFDQS